MHEDERHGVLGPIGFDEGREGAVAAAEEWVRSEGGLEVVEQGAEVISPFGFGNWFAVTFAAEFAKWSDLCLEVWDEAGAEIQQADEGVEGLAGARQWPVGHEVEFGGSRAVAVGSEIKANPLHSLKEEVAFLGVE